VAAGSGGSFSAFGDFECMTVFLPFLLILLAAILLRNLLPFIFRILGWRTGGTLLLEERVGAILFLFCSAVMAGIAYWYPWYLCTYHAAPDDRYGFALLFALPFYYIGAAISGVALFRLVRVVIRGQHRIADGIFMFCGVLLAVAGFSPLLMLGWETVSR
jgi:hypothetical protein